MISVEPRLLRVTAASFFAALVALALGYPATAAAEPPVCPNYTVTIGNQGQVVDVPREPRFAMTIRPTGCLATCHWWAIFRS